MNDVNEKSKVQAKNFILKSVYSTNKKLSTSKAKIKTVENAYKRSFSNVVTLSELLEAEPKAAPIIERLGTGTYEIAHQLEKKQALQPGVLAECVFSQTLADILGLKKHLNFKTIPINDVPEQIRRHLCYIDADTCHARYIYYSPDDLSKFLIQYGGPHSGDAVAVANDVEVRIEIKDMPALVGDKDLFYDEDGILSDSTIVDEYPIYVKFIEIFNAETNMFEQYGSNFKLDAVDRALRTQLVRDYLAATDVDIILTSKNDELIAFTSDDLDYVFDDGTPFIDTTGSEIRSCGRNGKKPFTPKFMDRVLADLDVEITEDGVCVLDPDKVIGARLGWRNGRGKGSNKSRYKLHPAFYVKRDSIAERVDGKLLFAKSKIIQAKSGISIHVTIANDKTKPEIGKALYGF